MEAGYTDANAHSATDANAQVGAIAKAAPNASAQTIEFPYWKFLVHPVVEEIADRMLHLPSFLGGLSRLVHVHGRIA